MKIFQKLVQYFYIPKLKKLEKEIGCRLIFNHIPDRYINGIVNCEMTRTWKKAGLNIELGQNHFTMGKIVEGKSTRFKTNSAEYQSWLGGYTVKLSSNEKWTFEEYFGLAIADQNSWLKWYGNSSPKTSIEGKNPVVIGKIRLGKFKGTLYEFGCHTYSDVVPRKPSLKLYFASSSMAALYNIYNPKLKLKASAFIPTLPTHPYENIDLLGYIAVLNVSKNVRVVLYGNGVIFNSNSRKDTFKQLKWDILNAMKSCEIIEL